MLGLFGLLLPPLCARWAGAEVSVALSAAGALGRDYDFFAEGVTLALRRSGPASLLIKGVGTHIKTREATLNPLEPDPGLRRSHHYARVLGGLRLDLPRYVSVEAVAGKDALGSRAHRVEAALSWWPLIYSYMPLQLQAGFSYDDRTRVRGESLGATMGLGRWGGLRWFLSGAGAVFRGGLLPKAEGRASGALSFDHPTRRCGLRAGGGGGASGPFFEFALFQAFEL